MPVKQSEAIVLRSYPVHEADLLVTFFTRSEGKVKGVAKSAKKSRRRFGGALEPLTCVRAFWEDRERQELSRLDSCEVLWSPLAGDVDYARAVALGHVAEMLDELLADRDPNDAVFRLAWSVVQCMPAGNIWAALTYFDLWMVRLMGFLPALEECTTCGRPLAGQRAFFHAMADGLVCMDDKRLASSEMSDDSRRIAAAMFRAPVEKFLSEPWPRSLCADLRKYCREMVERHIERKMLTTAQLEKM